MSSVDTGPIVEWLRALLEAGTNRAVGDTESPFKNPSKADFPYSILYAIPGGSFWGPHFTAPDGNADLVFQVSSMGLRPDQARHQADAVRRTLVARQADGSFQVKLDPPQGYEISDRVPAGGPPEEMVESQYTPTVYTIPERYIIRVVAGDPPT